MTKTNLEGKEFMRDIGLNTNNMESFSLFSLVSDDTSNIKYTKNKFAPYLFVGVFLLRIILSVLSIIGGIYLYFWMVVSSGLEKFQFLHIGAGIILAELIIITWYLTGFLNNWIRWESINLKNQIYED